MSLKTSETSGTQPPPDASRAGQARRRRLMNAFTALAFIALAAVALYSLSLIIQAVTLLLLSALLAYFLTPLIRFFQRRLAPAPAIILAYLLVAGALATALIIVTSSLTQQITSLVKTIQFLLSPAGKRQAQPLFDFLGKLGITQSQLPQYEQQALAQVRNALSGVLPFLITFFSNLINFIVIITLSVYFVLDGPRIVHWLRFSTPLSQRERINFLLDALDQSLGGYFRGSLLIALIGAVGVGVGLALLHVPYAALLGVLFFFLYFVPVVGAYVIEALCILAALPQGWVVMLIVAVYLTLLQGVVLGQILSPRVFSQTVGVHPIVALFALFAGAELFGLLGGLLSVPVAGVLQHIIVALWRRWKNRHPEEFPPGNSSLSTSNQAASAHDSPVQEPRQESQTLQFSATHLS